MDIRTRLYPQTCKTQRAWFKLLLSFHYSDYWTNGLTQCKPHEWENLDFDDLKTALYDFTYEFMQNAGAGYTAEYASIGNDRSGICYPDGSVSNGPCYSTVECRLDAVKQVDRPAV